MGGDEATEQPQEGMQRRAFLQRAAVVSGATLWAAPTVQSIMAPAFAVGTGLCPPGRLVRFKYEVDENRFDSGMPRGNGAAWCLPDGYSDATIEVNGAGNSVSFMVGTTTYTITVTITNDGKTAHVQLPAGSRIEDLQAKAGSMTNGECNDVDSQTSDTAVVTLQRKGISFVAGVICI